MNRNLVTAGKMLASLKLLVREDKRVFLPNFFRAFPGGYGEGDRFLGVVVPDTRAVAKQFYSMPLKELQLSIHSPWHEMRLAAVFVLQKKFERAKLPPDRKYLVQFLLDNMSGVNNWDIVDTAGPKILGAWLARQPGERKILRTLARSKNLWEQRISIVATMPLVKQGEFDDLLWIAGRMLNHPHDLIHKATGWLLREMGKKDQNLLLAFLDKHVVTMPRTMLRYSLEKLPPAVRQNYLKPGGSG